MDANEIMGNKEVIEVTEDIATLGLEKGIKVVAGIGLTIVVGGLAYQYIVKPMWAKIKARKNREEVYEVTDDFEVDDVEGIDEDE